MAERTQHASMRLLPAVCPKHVAARGARVGLEFTAGGQQRVARRVAAEKEQERGLGGQGGRLLRADAAALELRWLERGGEPGARRLDEPVQ
eukprot:2419736-Prymnesium_polylepis.1